MTRLFTDGFEMGDLLSFDSNSGSFGVQNAQKRTGSYSFGTYGGIYGNQSIRLPFTTSTSEIFIRIPFWQGTYGTYGGGQTERVYIRKGGTVIAVVVFTSSYTIQLYSGDMSVLMCTTPVAFSGGTWNLLEIRLKIASAPDGIATIRVDGIDRVTFTGNTKPGADTTVDNLWFYVLNNNTAAVQWLFDDVAINDSSGGSVDNSWCGDGHIVALLPNGNITGESDFLGSDGNNTDNYLLVDETPSNGDTDYVESPNIGDQDLYDLTPIAAFVAGQVVLRVWTEVRAKALAMDASKLTVGIKSGSVEAIVTQFPLNGSYAGYKGAAVVTDPNDAGQPFSETAINALMAGIKATND